MGEMDTARMDSGKSFWSGSSGRWAGERLLEALQAGQNLSPATLRTAATLRKDEWVAFDEALIEAAVVRTRGVSDLINAGLTMQVPNSMGKTVLEYEKISDMDPASVSLDGMVRTENDRVEFGLSALPLPITHKDFFLNLRTLTASRLRGEPLDTTQVRIAGRKIAEMQEQMLFSGGKTFGGNPIYGYTTHPDRNTISFGAGGTWSGAGKTGEQMLADSLLLISTSETDRMYGPWVIYVSRNMSTRLDGDFKANSDKTIRQRLLEVEGINSIRVVDFLAADNVVMVQMTSDVVVLVQGEPLQTVQWDIEGGFGLNLKAFIIQVPLIRSDIDGKSGIVHMS